EARYYSAELRWDGVSTLAQALDMVREAAKVTPEGEWVRVVGGWSPYQFAEKRMPTPEELTAAAPDTPVFVLHLYTSGLYNRKGLE
ncbi:amidohydrolase family protein, partial [Pantoea sp. SIMBA_079]|uniref:amidohydrolase family protein n=1 Tax=Pantoea sp. SIMBA_079 TaxID=3085817 RepID=UPI0039954CB5